MAGRAFKDRIYPQFARVGVAVASDRRLELLDLLSQAPRHVEALASEAGMSVANASQHLQILRSAGLVESERNGTRVVYRLADRAVLDLWLALRRVAEARLAEVDRIVQENHVEGAEGKRLSRDELEPLEAEDKVVVDVRPAIEYEYGHLPGAISIPLEELSDRLADLPADRDIVVYCRGAYCRFADEAIVLLRRHGFSVQRLEGGWQEWRAENRPVAK